MSYLTQSYGELQTAVIAALETAASLTFTPKTETVTEFYARCLGQSTLWKTKDEGELLALLNADNGGSSVSDKTYSYARLLDTLGTTLAGSGGGGDAYEGPLDIVTAVIGYSQRALSAAMLGQPVISVNGQAFSADAVTGAQPDAEIVAFLNGDPGYMTRWNNQGTYGSSWDFTNITNTGFAWVAGLLNGKAGMRSVTPYADNTTFIDGLSTQNLLLPMTVFAVVGENINSGLESTGAGDQAVFSSLDCSFDAWKDGFTTEAGVGLTTPVTGVHLHEISVGAASRSYRIDGAVQTGLAYDYGEGSEQIPVNGAWVINSDAGAVVLEIFYCSGTISGSDMTSVRENMATYYGITLS